MDEEKRTTGLKAGFTTGSCAAAAAKAAATMLLLGIKSDEVTIKTPKGILYHAVVLDLKASENEASCAVEKDGGDDPDVTTGSLIYASVHITGRQGAENGTPVIGIDGGKGVGRVTRPGLDMPVGSAAINSVPREMIRSAVSEVCALADFDGQLFVEISVPGGDKLAEKTFNPRLGIEGGISILGTTGVVEPMSEKALKDTIFVELRQRRALGNDSIVMAPGNYGRDFLEREYGFDIDKAVKCSNFIGEAVDMALSLGFDKMLLVGHIGKLVKVSGGIMNTHSKEADSRMELMAAAALKAGADSETACKILDCLTTDEALGFLESVGKIPDVMDVLMSKIMFYLDRRAQKKMKVECIMFSNEYGTLAKSEGAEWFISQERDRERQT